jgi:hypothetical protein
MLMARRTFLFLAALVGLCALLLVFAWSGGYEGVNGQDGHDHWRLARAWMDWWLGGARPRMAEHPHGYPFLGALVGMSGMGALAGLRVVSLVAFVVLVLVARSILVQRHGPTSGATVDRYLLVTLATSPFLLRYSATVMSDVTAMALLLGALAMALRWLRTGRIAAALWCVLLGAWALWVRMAAAPVLLVLGLALVVGPLKGRGLRVKWVGSLSVAGIVVFLATGLVDMGNGQLWVPLADWSPMNALSRVQRSDDGELHYLLPNFIYVLKVFVHPAFLLLGAALIWFMRREELRHPMSQWIVAALLTYLAFIACLPFQNDRVLLLALPFVVLLLFPAYARLERWLERRRLPRSFWVLAVLLLQLVLAATALRPFMQQAQVERELAVVVNSSGVSHVYTHGMGAAFSNYCPDMEVIELWYEEFPRMKEGALLVVRLGDMGVQWRGHPPARNWAVAQRQGMDTVAIHPAGWLVARLR